MAERASGRVHNVGGAGGYGPCATPAVRLRPTRMPAPGGLGCLPPAGPDASPRRTRISGARLLAFAASADAVRVRGSRCGCRCASRSGIPFWSRIPFLESDSVPDDFLMYEPRPPQQAPPLLRAHGHTREEPHPPPPETVGHRLGAFSHHPLSSAPTTPTPITGPHERNPPGTGVPRRAIDGRPIRKCPAFPQLTAAFRVRYRARHARATPVQHHGHGRPSTLASDGPSTQEEASWRRISGSAFPT